MSKDYYLENVQQFINMIGELSDQYPSHITLDNPVVNKFLYRGHASDEFQLLPGVLRKKNIAHTKTADIEENQYTKYVKEQSILRRFIQEAQPYVSHIDHRDLVKWAILAQHYGAPTRFLDWTSNPLVALFFSCYNYEEKDAVLWMCHTTNYSRYLKSHWFRPENDTRSNEEIATALIYNQEDDGLPYLPILLSPYYEDERMAMQSSRFMVWGRNENALETIVTDDYYMTLPSTTDTSITSEETDKQFFFRFRIRSEHKQGMIRQLELLGVSSKTVFPGLDGVGQFIERHYRYDYHEAVQSIVEP